MSEAITVQPGTTLRTVDQPHELPHGVSAESLGLRTPAAPGSARSALAQAGYDVVETLGQGGMGEVYLARKRDAGPPRASAKRSLPPRLSSSLVARALESNVSVRRGVSGRYI